MPDSVRMSNQKEKVEKECLSLQNVDNNHNSAPLVDKAEASPEKTTISDLIGEWGCFQFTIVLLAFTRYVILAMMTNSGALIAPEAKFQCQVPGSLVDQIDLPANESLFEFSKNKCTLKLKNQTEPFKCTKFAYLDQEETGKTLTNTFDLVCDRDSLRSTFQSTVTLGVIASVFWGSISDRFGREITYKVCFVWSLIFGLLSYVATNYLTFTIARALCTLGDVGLVISITAVVVETLGNKYRGSMCILIYTGWSVGVMIMPWLIELYRDFQQLMFMTVVCHLLTLPWLLYTVGESARWLLVEGYFKEASSELKRINSWNGDKSKLNESANGSSNGGGEDYEIKFELLKQRYLNVSRKRRAERELEATWSRCKFYLLLPFGGFSKMGELFLTRELTIVTLATAWITFNGEFFYMFTTQINSDIGADIKLNYSIGGVMEILATIVSIFMISLLRRKLSLFLTLLTMSSTCFALATAILQAPLLSTWIFNLLKFATSTLTSLIYVVVTELYPTNLRQTGMGVTGLLGSSGAFIAPYIRTELVKLIDLPTVLYVIAMAPITALIAIFLIRETRGVELTDDIDELCDTHDNTDNNTDKNRQQS